MAKASTTPTANAAASASAQAQAARHALHVQRKAEAVQMQAAGLSPKDIAVRLGISTTTVLRMIAPATAAPIVAAPVPAAPAPNATGPSPAKPRPKRIFANLPSHPRMIIAKDRRARCLEMRIAGLSEREIAARLGVSKTQVVRMLATSLDALNASEMNGAQRLRRIELERCEKMMKGLMPHFRDPRYVDSLLRIQERAANYLGLDAPKREEVIQKTMGVEEQLDLSALAPEELRTLDEILAKCGVLVQEAHRAKT
jgi:DNA-binding CsgD family transcriptional regulator